LDVECGHFDVADFAVEFCVEHGGLSQVGSG
jgi:hypothetical protein